MILAAQIALTAIPLSAYFYILGTLQGGRRPRVVSGPVDFALLAFGAGGLVAFGPVGQVVVGRVVGGGAGVWAWSAWTALLAAWTFAFSGWTARRVAIYNIDRAGLDGAVRAALNEVGGDFRPTLRGYEDPARRSGVLIQASSRFLAGAVEAYGTGPEELIRALEPKLREAVARIPRRPSIVATALFAAACLATLVPAAAFLLTHPRARQAFRAILRPLGW